MSPSLHRPGSAVALLLTAVLAVGCAADAAPAAPPAEAATAAPVPDDEPEVEPTPEPPSEVRGEVVDVVVADLSVANSGLFRDGHERDVTVPADEAAIEAHVRAVADWLDAHLTDLETGGPGRVGDAGLTGDAHELSSGLTAPDRKVTSARYAVTVGARGLPEWLRASVTLGRDAEGDTTATFVFVAAGDGEVRLVAAEPGVGTIATPGGSTTEGAP